MKTQTSLFLATCFAAVAVCGCQKKTAIDDPDARQMVELLMPQRVEVVEAFTGFKSFDADETPDGIELLLQATDSFGDPVKMAGVVRIELYTFVQASANRAGERVCAPWEVTLVSEADQQRYWNMVTGMYEVPLEFPDDLSPRDLSPGGHKYVLQVTYNTPLGTHLTDECVLTASLRS